MMIIRSLRMPYPSSSGSAAGSSCSDGHL